MAQPESVGKGVVGALRRELGLPQASNLSIEGWVLPPKRFTLDKPSEFVRV
jgi:hypothetical protein